MNDIRVFENSEFGELGVLLDDSKVYFPAVRCAEILGYKNPRKAIRDHCREDGGTIRSVMDSIGRPQRKKFITEGNLYRLIIKSKLESAQRFEIWVFDEVLPSIRKHGFYASDDVLESFLNDPDMAIGAFSKLKEERDKVKRLEAENKRLYGNCRYLDTILNCESTVPITVIAKDYGMTGNEMNMELKALGIQYKLPSGTWVLYDRYANAGYTKSNTFVYDENKGRCSVHTVWTQLGRKFIYDKLKSIGIVPICERRNIR